MSLHTGRVRALNAVHDLGIDVVADELPTHPCPGHSLIVNLPERENPALRDLAERMASLLRDQSRPVPNQPTV